MRFGEWNVDVVVDGMPEKVATAFVEFNDSIVGAEYTPIAYLGLQLVNGTNHAVLAEQLLTTGKDTRNIVVVIFNEKEDVITLANIERVLEGGDGMGAIEINKDTSITQEANDIFLKAAEGFAGVKVEPFAFLATQVVSGINYIFAAVVTPVTAEPKEKVCLVTVNTLIDRFSFTDILTNKVNADAVSLGPVTLQSPWTTYAEEIMQFFKNDSDVKVVYDGKYSIKLYVEKDKKADALMRLLPNEKVFGNVVITIEVIPADDFEEDEDDNLSVAEVFDRAFEGNPALAYTKVQSLFPGVDAPITFVVWAHEIVQFFNDDLTDINGNKTTLYQEIAPEIFGVFDNTYYCTDVDLTDAE